MAERDIEDMERVLALTWRGGAVVRSKADVARSWSLDWQWLEPGEAEVAVQSHILAGWLVESEEGVAPASLPKEAQAPLGWFPRSSLLLKPPPSPYQTYKGSSPTTLPTMPEQSIKPAQSNDSVAIIAEATGLERSEVERRCARKQRALGPVEQWFCLALLLREAGVPVSGLISKIR